MEPETKEYVINQIMNMAVSAGGVPEHYRIYYVGDHGRTYRGADLEHANIVGRNFAEAYLQARSYILANAMYMHDAPVDIIFNTYSVYNPLTNVAEYINDLLTDFAWNDTLWMQKANEPCNMEWD